MFPFSKNLILNTDFLSFGSFTITFPFRFLTPPLVFKKGSIKTFQGTFENFQMPKLLYALIKLIIVGPHMELQSEVREGRIDNTVSVITQAIVQVFKTTRQVNYKPKCETNEKAFYDKRETPLNVGLGLILYQSTRSMRLI